MHKTFAIMALTSIALAACNNTSPADDAPTYIGRSQQQAVNHRLTPELLQELGKISDLQASPDGKQVLYGVTYASVSENRSNRELYVMNIDGTDNHAITHTPYSEQNAVWIQQGERIAFLCSESGSSQVWTMRADGSDRQQLSHFDRDIEGFVISPDEQHILMIAAIPVPRTDEELYAGLDKTTGAIYDDLMYRHWNDFVGNYPHPYLAPILSDGSIGEAKDLLEGEPYECPMRPFGGVESFAFSPDSKAIVYVCRKKTGKDYAFSTNSDLWYYDIAAGTTRLLTEGMMGYDTAPAFSPDGTRLAWCSMERDGYESDKNRLMVMTMPDGKPTDLTARYDNNCDGFAWTPDGKHIIMLSYTGGTCQVMQCTLPATDAPAQIRQISDGGDYDYSSLCFAGNRLLTTRHSMSQPDEIYHLDPQTRTATQLTFENRDLLADVEMGRIERRYMRCTNGDTMLVWIAYPAGFDSIRAQDPDRKFPTLLYCQGGPQSPVSQFWSTRWNIQMMTSNGYAVVLPNRHGVPGFGQAWNEQISGDYSGQCIDDYFTAIDEIAREPWCDKDNLGAVGASFGGYSVYYLAGHHQGRFKCFIAHCGIFNLESMWGETEEMWFINHDFGGAYYDKQNAVAQRTYANSPHHAVAKWDTPILVIHNEKDYRIPVTQGMQAFNIARMRDIPARFLYFPDECHWVSKPQNGVLWQRVFFNWLDRWLKEEQ